ncbi:anthocyanidin 3-O-glucosyltransferase 2-like [Silene latifolia]|uniref:anthocyanidin 3-O-glucosyltransferase 2-like n=1 Tax=Silene latifolia TaxID=37657 RepID=UPI003D7826C6
MSNTAELVFVPVPSMGHMLSTLQLAKLILQTNQTISISIYIVKLPNATASVDTYVESQSRDNPYPTRLTFVTFPPLPNPPDKSATSFSTVLDLYKPIVKKAIEDRIRDGFPKPVGFVLDMFCTTMLDVANELGIPSYVFFTSGANFLNLNLHAQSLIDDHGVDVVTEFSDPGFTVVVPGFKNPVPSKVIPSSMQLKSPFCELIFEFTRRFRKMKGILVNTYAELESLPIQALLNSDIHKIPPVYPVGPLVELDSKGNAESVIEWLDCQPESSVVFLCFGRSMGIFDEEQVKEIANGLEKSGHRFLWSLRKPPPPEGSTEAPSNNNDVFLEALPEGFIDRTSHIGKIIGWAPQVAILAHPAIGGFVSHCGWNSTLECLWFGVPMATWPLYAEQQLNAFELVKELELAVEIRIDYKMDVYTRKGNFLVTAAEIENGVKNLMSMDDEMREKVKKKSDEGKKALQGGGSSYNSLGCFIEDVLSNIA